MEFIVLLSLMTAFASSASLDGEMCWAGESFWCQSLANAEACRAVDHCRETVWKNQELEENNTPTCNQCQKIIEFIAERNFSGVIESTLLDFFCQGACPFQMVCKGFVELLVPHIVNNVKLWLRSERFQFCTTFGYCNGSKNSASFSLHQDNKQLPTVKKSSVCQLCIQVSKTIMDSESVNKTEATVMNVMGTVCDSLWLPHGNHCHKMVDAIGRPALEKLYKRLHPEGACQMLGFCEGASAIDIISESIIAEIVASERCSYCQSAVEYLAVLLRHGRAVNEIQTQVKKICEFHSFGMDKEECEFVVDKYIPILVDHLIDDLSRDNVCQMEQFCGRESKTLTEDVRATDSDDFIFSV